jgi:hypothetical protein
MTSVNASVRVHHRVIHRNGFDGFDDDDDDDDARLRFFSHAIAVVFLYRVVVFLFRGRMDG